jgi:hypothetical protein
MVKECNVSVPLQNRLGSFDGALIKSSAFKFGRPWAKSTKFGWY